MNYLDMILAEAATPVAEKNNNRSLKGRAASRADRHYAAKAAKGSSSLDISYKKTSAVAKKKMVISKLERMIASGKDENGRELNPDKIRALKAQLAAEKKACAELEAKAAGKSKSRRFDYHSSSDHYNSSASGGGSGSSSSDGSSSSTQEKIYLEGFYDALEEMGYFDEDYDVYDEDYDDYDDYDEEDAYLEGYYSALADYGYDF